jgi:hypothetical protein
MKNISESISYPIIPIGQARGKGKKAENWGVAGNVTGMM